MKALHQTGEWEETKDGMDISLCIIDEETKLLDYSAAYNSLYVIRAGELVELKADRMPIGVDSIEEVSFSSNRYELQPNDCLYLFSDGYADQFGGSEGKKLKYGPFQKILLRHHKKSMERQRDALGQDLIKWMGDYPQLDDILVIGMRIV
jgi:serine phosphatase RsbU (regulator of sigma subunit)